MNTLHENVPLDVTCSVLNFTNRWTYNGNVFEYEIICTSQYGQMLIPLWCHTNGVIQSVVVDIKKYIGAHDIGDS